mmetsp:Transcript_2219/g.5492  ORF Transcript_2219/g.5492 Transcript_2219/m.5492 type:complete len:1164 (-) Transcript_2219:203-3694(-)
MASSPHGLGHARPQHRQPLPLQFLCFVLLVALGHSERLRALRRSAAASDSAKTIVLLGGTGAGKSTLANYLAGKDDVFIAGDAGHGVTKDVKLVEIPFFGKPELGMVRLVDTPGLMDPDGFAKDMEQWQAVCESLRSTVQTATALVLVLNGAQTRHTEDVRRVIKQIRESFGKDFWRFLRVVVTRVKWDSVKQQAEGDKKRELFLDVETSVAGQGLLDPAVKKQISNLPIIGVNLEPDLMYDDLREYEFEAKDADELEGYSLGEIIRLDADLQAKCREEGYSSFREWKRNVKGLKKMFKGWHLQQMYQWGTSWGSNNIGRLEDLRHGLCRQETVLELQPTSLTGETHRILINAVTIDGLELGSARYVLAADSTVGRIVEQAVRPMRRIRTLHSMPSPKGADSEVRGWIKDITLFSGRQELITDRQLQEEVRQMLNPPKGASPPSELRALVEWADNSPPRNLDPKLLRICIEQEDMKAADSMVKDRLTQASQLAFAEGLESHSLHKLFPKTAKHGAVWSKLKALALQEKNAVRSSKPFQQVLEEQKEKRDVMTEKILHTRDELQPFLDEMKVLASQEAEESATKGREIVMRAKNQLESVRASDVIRVPTEIPSSVSELASFMRGVEQNLESVGMNLGGEVLGVDDLIYKSRVLKGVYLSVEPKLSANDMMQLMEVPKPNHILGHASKPGGPTDMVHRSQTSLSKARELREKGGESFSASGSAGGVLITKAGIGAMHLAAKIAEASESEKDASSRGRTETATYFMTRDYSFPMASLQLDNSVLRLSQTVFEQVATVMQMDRSYWVVEINNLFQVYGTHYCPSVELGGVWTQEAEFREQRGFSEGQVRSTISKCFDFDIEGSGGFFSLVGFGRMSAAGGKQLCQASGDGTSSQEQDLIRDTRLSRRCFPQLAQCPASDRDFNSAMQANGNWAVIDRNMPQCVPIWDAVKRERVGLAAALTDTDGIDMADALAVVDQFRDMAQKIWHVYVLNLPQMCKSLDVPQALQAQCARVEHNQDPVEHVSLGTILSLWERLTLQAGDDQKKRQQCAALDYCNYGMAEPHGECQWRAIPGTKIETAYCSCYRYFTGATCQTRIPEKTCKRTKRNSCTSHPMGWFQDDCEAHGSGWEYDTWEFCGFITGVGGQYVCKKEWKCQPTTPDSDCCLED